MGTQPKKICIEQRRACRRLRLRKRYCEFVESLGIGSVPVRASGAWFLVDRSDYIANDIAFWAIVFGLIGLVLTFNAYRREPLETTGAKGRGHAGTQGSVASR